MQPCEQKENIVNIKHDIECLSKRMDSGVAFWEKMYVVLNKKSKLEKLLIQKENIISKLRRELEGKRGTL